MHQIPILMDLRWNLARLPRTYVVCDHVSAGQIAVMFRSGEIR